MGYETKLYIVEKYSIIPSSVMLVKDRVVSVYDNNHYYGEDGNTRVDVANPVTYKSTSCSIIAMLDMHKMGGLSLGSICKFEEGDVHIFQPTNGNTYIGLDSYGDYRKFVPLADAIKLMAEVNKTEKYRRFDIALATMRAVKKAFNGENVGILEYGH